jgi:hypothetical protein
MFLQRGLMRECSRRYRDALVVSSELSGFSFDRKIKDRKINDKKHLSL